MKWIRLEPHWQGIYKSEAGTIKKKDKQWEFRPTPPASRSFRTLKAAKEFAETVVVMPGQTAAIGTSRIENSGDN